MNFIRTFLFLTFTLLISPSYASENAAPFGFEIGGDTITSARTKAIEKGFSDKISGENKYTGGLMLSVDASSANVNGVKELTLIFDQKEILQGITFNTSKNNFKAFDDYISQKYLPVTREVPFVGNKYAEYRAPNAIIKINAPHMGFDMSVTYISQDFLNKFNKVTEVENNKKKKNESSQF